MVAQLVGLQLASSDVGMFTLMHGVSLADQVAALASIGSGWQSVPLVPLDVGSAFRASPPGAPARRAGTGGPGWQGALDAPLVAASEHADTLPTALIGSWRLRCRPRGRTQGPPA